jgi:hypothetical protein
MCLNRPTNTLVMLHEECGHEVIKVQCPKDVDTAYVVRMMDMNDNQYEICKTMDEAVHYVMNVFVCQKPDPKDNWVSWMEEKHNTLWYHWGRDDNDPDFYDNEYNRLFENQVNSPHTFEELKEHLEQGKYFTVGWSDRGSATTHITRVPITDIRLPDEYILRENNDDGYYDTYIVNGVRDKCLTMKVPLHTDYAVMLTRNGVDQCFETMDQAQKELEKSSEFAFQSPYIWKIPVVTIDENCRYIVPAVLH